jgi:hypothetical protein
MIYLFNPGHNGDVLFSSEMAKILINSNKDMKFSIVPACSSFLFKDCINNNVSIEEHPRIWNHTSVNIHKNSNNHIENMHDTKWTIHNNDLYINTWLLLTSGNTNCISLNNRVQYIINQLKEIEINTSIHLNFNCESYKELIPNLPDIKLEHIISKLKKYNKRIIFFYNQTGYDTYFSLELTEKFILNLINLYSHDSIILLSKPTTIKHECILDVESEFNSIPVINGENLVLNAKIANLSDIVYFRFNGGSLFVLNNENIKNSNKVKYYFIGHNEDHKVIVEDYGLNCELIKIENI